MNDENLAETQHFQPGNHHSATSVSDAASSTEFNPLVTIWTSPRQTIRQILNTDPTLYILPLICLYGIAEFLDSAADEKAGEDLSVAAILLLACVIGPLMGFVSIWVLSHLVRISGSWLGGSGEYRDIKPALVWGTVPTIAALPLWIPIIGILGRDAFTDSSMWFQGEPFSVAILVCLVVLKIVLLLWSLVISCHTVAEVQGFRSAWKGFGNLVLAILLILLPLIFIVVVIALLAAALS